MKNDTDRKVADLAAAHDRLAAALYTVDTASTCPCWSSTRQSRVLSVATAIGFDGCFMIVTMLVLPRVAHTLRPPRSAKSLMPEPRLTSSRCPEVRYSVENATCCIRSHVAVIVRITMSTSRRCRTGIRSAVVIARHCTASGLPSSALAISRARSISKPTTCPVTGSR